MADLSHIPRILVVEDDGLIALDIETTLQDAGAAEVITMATAADALLAIDKVAFDVVVLDLHLGPGGPCYGVARRLREKGVPFVFSSGSSEIADEFRDVPLVTKPFSSDQLVQALLGATAGPATVAAE